MTCVCWEKSASKARLELASNLQVTNHPVDQERAAVQVSGKQSSSSTHMDVQNRSVAGRLAGRLWLGQLLPETRRSYVVICVALWSTISFLVAQHCVVTSVVVQGKSMMPTLKPGDCLFVNCLLPHFRDYRRGDIVVIRDPANNEFIVKRIVGVPHDHVQVRSGRVYVNDQLLPEPYLDLGTETTSGRLNDRVVTIQDSSYFVMGDNRAESDDSRFFGDVNRRDLMGIISR